MDVHYLTGLLISDSDKIIGVLEALGYNPRDKGKYITCRNLDGDNDSAIAIYKDKLTYKNFTRDRSGNLITLIMDTKDYSFPEALKWLAKELGVKADKPRVRVHYPFGGFYRQLQPEDSERVTFTKYDEGLLPPADNLSYKFFIEGIDYKTQEYYGVRYSHEDDAILIPIRNWYGQLVGVKARTNQDEDKSHRWYAWLSYPKTGCLFGWFQNYKAIVETHVAVIVESEKSVMQMHSFGCHLGLAIGGHDISPIQAKYLKALQCDIILALDEDISEEENERQAAKLDGCRVSFIKDREHRFLKFGGKESPTDLGKTTFKKLLKECLVRYKS